MESVASYCGVGANRHSTNSPFQEMIVSVNSSHRCLIDRSSLKANRPRERGQVVVEYVLLLIVSVTIAFVITRLMVGRDPGNPGFVISTWQAIVEEIGSDRADDIRRN